MIAVVLPLLVRFGVPDDTSFECWCWSLKSLASLGEPNVGELPMGSFSLDPRAGLRLRGGVGIGFAMRTCRFQTAGPSRATFCSWLLHSILRFGTGNVTRCVRCSATGTSSLRSDEQLVTQTTNHFYIERRRGGEVGEPWWMMERSRRLKVN